MRVSPSYIRSQGYNLQEYAATHDGQTSPPFSKAATMLAWFAIYPRSEGERTLTARWQEDDIFTEVTANLGPRGGLSSPGERQGLQYRHYNQVSDVVQTGVIRADGMVHITTMPGGDPETVHDKEAAERIYRDLGSAALVFTVPAPAMNSVPGSSNRPQNGLRLTRVSTDQKQHERPRAGSRYGAVVYQSL